MQLAALAASLMALLRRALIAEGEAVSSSALETLDNGQAAPSQGSLLGAGPSRGLLTSGKGHGDQSSFSTGILWANKGVMPVSKAKTWSMSLWGI